MPTPYRLNSEFQAGWKAEVGHWLLFANRCGFLDKLSHRVIERAKKIAAVPLPDGSPDPNDTGHKVLLEELAPAQVAYYLDRNGWSFREWEPSVVSGDVDLRWSLRPA